MMGFLHSVIADARSSVPEAAGIVSPAAVADFGFGQPGSAEALFETGKAAFSESRGFRAEPSSEPHHESLTAKQLPVAYPSTQAIVVTAADSRALPEDGRVPAPASISSAPADSSANGMTDSFHSKPGDLSVEVERTENGPPLDSAALLSAEIPRTQPSAAAEEDSSARLEKDSKIRAPEPLSAKKKSMSVNPVAETAQPLPCKEAQPAQPPAAGEERGRLFEVVSAESIRPSDYPAEVSRGGAAGNGEAPQPVEPGVEVKSARPLTEKFISLQLERPAPASAAPQPPSLEDQLSLSASSVEAPSPVPWIKAEVQDPVSVALERKPEVASKLELSAARAVGSDPGPAYAALSKTPPARPSSPDVRIGQIDVFIEGPPRSTGLRPNPQRPTLGLASRYFLRRI
jgi:hypothetical protein